MLKKLLSYARKIKKTSYFLTKWLKASKINTFSGKKKVREGIFLFLHSYLNDGKQRNLPSKGTGFFDLLRSLRMTNKL